MELITPNVAGELKSGSGVANCAMVKQIEELRAEIQPHRLRGMAAEVLDQPRNRCSRSPGRRPESATRSQFPGAGAEKHDGIEQLAQALGCHCRGLQV